MTLWFFRSLVLVFTIFLLLIIFCFSLFRNSLPVLEGRVRTEGIESPVDIIRDEPGVPLIKGASRTDVAFATGFLHAQERFFQMDLSRRNSAGELSELVGNIAIEHDKKQRKHAFQKVARKIIEQMPDEQKTVMEAYSKGVNEGLNTLESKPFEYWLLNVDPAPWKLEDSFLAVFSMYMDLNDYQVKLDGTKGFLATFTTSDVIEFLSPSGTRWDSPLIEDHLPEALLPGPDKVNLRNTPASLYANLTGELIEDAMAGSNNWAVSGQLTKHGGALIESDMHLKHRVPNIWYRARIQYPDPLDPFQTISVTGVTLPGAPLIVAGSNGQVAWAFTNSYGDWVDLVQLEEDGNVYSTTDGPEVFYNWSETINVKGQKSVIADYQATRWGPVISSRYDESRYALRWTAHYPDATNINLINLETASNTEEAMSIATGSGIPPQNFTVGDSAGNIGWTIAGRIPGRSGLDSTFPLSWEKADSHWQGWLSPEDYPRVFNPDSGRIWTANARVASGADYQKLGNGGYALGPRQKQIRDRLMALDQADEQQFLEIALDSNAVYMGRWRQLILETLDEKGLSGNTDRQIFYKYVNNWSGRAATEDVGYRLVREFNDTVSLKILQFLGRYFLSLSGRQNLNIEDTWLQNLNHEEEMIWRLLDEQPIHWLSPVYGSWNELFLESVDAVIERLGGAEELSSATWGAFNVSSVKHPLSDAIPFFGSLLNMPVVALEGDLWMPRTQRPSDGVSERMIVAPGREEQGIFHMPGGQSGHPLSPFYKKGYLDWVHGRKKGFLPQEAKYHLTLEPEL